MTTGDDATNPMVYGEFSHSFILEHNQIIEIVVNNLGKHLPLKVKYALILTGQQTAASIPSIFMAITSRLLRGRKRKLEFSTPQIRAKPTIQQFQCGGTHLF
jgi:hypothetical protein